MSLDRIDGLIGSYRAGAVVTPNRILKLDPANPGNVLMASSSTDAMFGVSRYQSTSISRYIQPQASSVAQIGNYLTVGAPTPNDSIAGDRIDVILTGIADIEYGATVTAGQALTSDAYGRAIPALPGAKIIGFATLSGTVSDIGNVLVNPGTSINDFSATQPLVYTPSAATIPVDASLGSVFNITLTQNSTLLAPINPTDGLELILFVTQGGSGSYTLALTGGAGGFSFGSTLSSITLSTAVGKTDIIKTRYSLAANKWYVTGFNAGY